MVLQYFCISTIKLKKPITPSSATCHNHHIVLYNFCHTLTHISRQGSTQYIQQIREAYTPEEAVPLDCQAHNFYSSTQTVLPQTTPALLFLGRLCKPLRVLWFVIHSLTHSLSDQGCIRYMLWCSSSNFHSSFEHAGQPTFYTGSVLVKVKVQSCNTRGRDLGGE